MGILIAIVVMLALYYYFFVLSRQVWDIVDTPTVSPSGAIIGLCEIQGKAAPSWSPSGEILPVFTSPISGYPCVWFDLLVERYERDGEDSSWVTYRHKNSEGGFRISDQYGSVAVDPTKSEKYLTQTYKHSQNDQVIAKAREYFGNSPNGFEAAVAAQWTTSPDGYYMWHPIIKNWIQTRYVSPDRLYYYDWNQQKWISIIESNVMSRIIYGITNLGDDLWFKEKLRVTETVVYPDSDIFSHGYVMVTNDGTDLSIGLKNGSHSGFFLSSQGQGNLLKKLKIRKWIVLCVAVAISIVLSSVYLRGPIEEVFSDTPVGGRTWQSFLVQALIIFAMFLIGSLFLKIMRTYNRFVGLREQVHLSRSAIDITLKRRSTLIPELCDVLDEVMSHEKTVLDSIIRIRNENPDLVSKEILALAEAYPNIKSSENFLHMQNELARTEEKIAMSRSFLNDSILAMDNLRATLIGMVFSPLFAREQRPSM